MKKNYIADIERALYDVRNADNNAQILKHLPITCAHIFLNGQIVRSGGAELIGEVSERGYAQFEVES